MTKEEIKKKVNELSTQEDIIAFINERIKELESNSVETTIGQEYTNTFNDYISSKVHYKTVASLNNKIAPDLVYDDIIPYINLLKDITKSYYSELYIFTPIFFTIYNYMASKSKNTSIFSERMLLYWNTMQDDVKQISIKKFNENKDAYCSENSGLAHNMFKILGVDSQLVIGMRDKEPHAYNIIFPKGYGNSPAVLFDSSHHITFKNDKNEKILSFGYFKVLTDEEYNNMLSGNKVLINLDKSIETIIKFFDSTGMLKNCSVETDNVNYSIGLNNSILSNERN